MSENEAYWKDHFPQFCNSEDPEVDHLMASAKVVRLPAGQQVFYPGSVCENYLLMLEGSIKTQLIAENGREVLLYHVRPGDSCILTTSCLLGDDRYPAEGVTEQDVTAFAIASEAFHHCIDRSAFFRQFVFDNFSRRLSNVIRRMEEVIFEPIDKRLSRSLLELDQMLVTKTHQELAAELGTAREVVSRHLKRFEALGWVCLKRGSIELIDFIALKNLSR